MPFSVIAQTKNSVVLSEDDSSYTLANKSVTAKISKSSGVQTYSILTHKADYPVTQIGEARLRLRKANTLFRQFGTTATKKLSVAESETNISAFRFKRINFPYHFRDTK